MAEAIAADDSAINSNAQTDTAAIAEFADAEVMTMDDEPKTQPAAQPEQESAPKPAQPNF